MSNYEADDEPERWLPVVGYEGYYEVSDLGRARSLDRTITNSLGQIRPLRGHMMSQPLDSKGYRFVVLQRAPLQRMHRIHTLVLSTFRPESHRSGTEGCHRNGDRLDNRLDNLYWGTRSDNMLDTVAHGTHANAQKVTCVRGHLLSAPNLVASVLRDGRRQCLACNRAQNNVRSARDRRGITLELGPLADAHYRKIMA